MKIIFLVLCFVVDWHSSQLKMSFSQFLDRLLRKLIFQEGFGVKKLLIYGCHGFWLLTQNERRCLLERILDFILILNLLHEIHVVGCDFRQMMVAKNDSILSVIQLHSLGRQPFFAQELFVIGGFKVGIVLFFEVMIVSPHLVLPLFAVHEGIRGDQFLVVIVVVGGVYLVGVI